VGGHAADRPSRALVGENLERGRQRCLDRLRMSATLTQRVTVGAYYTNGQALAEVTRVSPLGHVQLRDCVTNEPFGHGIVAFRRQWWRVR
jgi:hypothetical protein